MWTVSERRYEVAVGIALVAGGAFVAVWRALTPAPGANAEALQVDDDPPPPRRLRILPGPPPDVPLGEEPTDDAKVRASWDERLAREDEALVQLAIAAGCDAARAEAMREVLATKRRERASTLEAFGAGRLTREEMTAREQETKRKADAALRELLTPQELEALHPDGARAAPVDEEER